MNQPVQFNFPDHYKNDSLIPVQLVLTYASGAPVNLTEATVLMQLKDIRDVVAWEFSSLASGIKKLTVLPDGVIELPRIPSWPIKAGVYYYDLQIISFDGSTRTMMRGTWKVNQDISN